MTEIPVPIVLASSSPTRRELLAGLVAQFEVVGPAIDEGALRADDPRSLVLKLAEAKARQVARTRPDALVIAADTLVACQGEVIGKPADHDDAVRILKMLTRSVHRVLTALFVVAPDGRERSACVESEVRMRKMSRPQIEQYLACADALERAGAYALQPDDPNVEHLEGSLTAVMGLPLEELERLLHSLYPGCGSGG